MRAIGIDLKRVVDNGLTLVDATHLVTIPQEVKIGERNLSRQEFSLLSLIESLRTKVQETNAKRVVIDPLAMLTILFPTEVQRRVAVADLVHQLSTIGTTNLLLTELQHNGARRSYQIEDYLSQGVISMRKVPRDNRIFNIIQIEKMRGIQHDTQPRFYELASGGISVVSEESVDMV
jgi:KaiC/GvpD/RAD55 family RecA-like ATPase